VLEGEGEEDDPDDDPGAYQGRVPAPRPAAHSEETRLRIHPPDTAKKIEWMKQFLALERGLEAEVLADLERALSAEDPAGELSGILNRNPDVRDSWYMFRAERLREMIAAWVAEHGVAFTEPPPWGQ
jgi:hypothetical protein